MSNMTFFDILISSLLKFHKKLQIKNSRKFIKYKIILHVYQQTYQLQKPSFSFTFSSAYPNYHTLLIDSHMSRNFIQILSRYCHKLSKMIINKLYDSLLTRLHINTYMNHSFK
ncbi:hypothetical protein ACKWTF_001173 [Chironomus riparius]